MKNTFWDNHYKKFSVNEPSLFAQRCIDRLLTVHDTVVELGCGNGRDGLPISQRVSRYFGLDACSIAIRKFHQVIEPQASLLAKSMYIRQADFTNLDFNEFAKDAKRLVIYSRFSLHSINYAAFDRLLYNLNEIVNVPWIIAVEARTIFDNLYGQGIKLGKHEFHTDHYRRFIDPDEFLIQLSSQFSIRYFEVNKGFAPFGGEDPIVMRTEAHSIPK